MATGPCVDFLQKPIAVGDTIVYPVGSSASLRLVKAHVMSIETSLRHGTTVPLLVVYAGGSQYSRLTRLDRVVIVTHMEV